MPRVGVAGFGEQRFRPIGLDDAPGLHHRDAIAVMRCDAKISGNYQPCRAVFSRQIAR